MAFYYTSLTLLASCLAITLAAPSSLSDPQQQYPVPNPFSGEEIPDDNYYLIESIQEWYKTGSSEIVRKQVSEYFNLKVGTFFSYETRINDYKPVGEPKVMISDPDTGRMFLATNPNGYPEFQCKVLDPSETQGEPWQYDQPIAQGSKTARLFGISGLWLSAIRDGLKSISDEKQIDEWFRNQNVWSKPGQGYEYQIGFAKPPAQADMDQAVAKTMLSQGRVTMFADSTNLARNVKGLEYFWVEKFMTKVDPKQDYLLRQILAAKQKCLNQ